METDMSQHNNSNMSNHGLKEKSAKGSEKAIHEFTDIIRRPRDPSKKWLHILVREQNEIEKSC